MKLISIVTPCFNEQDNVSVLYQQVKDIFDGLPTYNYEHIFIDNSSVDNTVEVLKSIATSDQKLKIIVNTRNFGPVRSPFHGLLQAKGDAVILVAADLQDPIILIPQFIKNWEKGAKIVVGTKFKSKENRIMFFIRKTFYNLISKISETEQIKNFTGFGLYDKSFINILKDIKDPFPYYRGLITEFGFNRIEIPYVQPIRYKGKTSTNFYSLYEYAMLGFVSSSMVPIRVASFVGFGLAFLSIFIAFIYFILKIIFWDSFSLGLAPLVIGMFLISGVQLFFLGIIGEYIGAIFTQVKKRPLVVEKERVNFDD
jgi:polyisoprenyl-phosphate glycosyltransferase